MEPPLVLFLDLDGTVIGDMYHLDAERELVARFCPGLTVPRMMRSAHVEAMRSGIMRPRFEDFMRKIQETNLDPDRTRHIQVFVYTASEDRRATYIISLLEDALGPEFTFNRPIFSRQYCIFSTTGRWSYLKNLAPLLPTVVATLRRKGYSVSVDGLKNRIALVDNTPDVVDNATDDYLRLITCPTYQFGWAYDVLRFVGINKLLANYRQIMGILAERGMYPPRTGTVPSSCRHFLSVYYTFLAARIADAARLEGLNGNAALSDRFWARLQAATLGVRTFDPRHVMVIDRKVNV